MIEHSVYLTACNVALTSLSTKDNRRIEKAYSIINELHKELLPFEKCMEEDFTADDFYDYAMYTYAEMELAIYHNNFEDSSLHLMGIITIADVCYKKYPACPNQTTQLIYNLHRRAGVRFWTFFQNLGHKDSMVCNCALCQNPNPDQTGSHLVPEMLLTQIFPRWKELAIAENLAKGDSYGYVGRDLAAHIDEIRGHDLLEPEREWERLIPNPLTRDNLLCRVCENRFSRLETLMSETHKAQVARQPYEPKIPYLFWLSIIWRMSVGKMSIQLNKEVEDHIREILDNSLPKNKGDDFHWENVETCYSYAVAYTTDLRDEPMGITGTHSDISPKVIAIGNIILLFFENNQQVDDFRKLDPYTHINNGTTAEIYDILNFQTYWDRRQFIAMHNAEYDVKHMGESELVDVFAPHPSIHHRRYLNDQECKVAPGDYASLRGIIPFPIPWSLKDIWEHFKTNHDLDIDEFAKDTLYSAEELKFMISQYMFRQKELIEHIEAYYKEIDWNAQKLNFVPTMEKRADGSIFIRFNPNIDNGNCKIQVK